MKSKVESVVSIDGVIRLVQRDDDDGYAAYVEVTADRRFSPRLQSLLSEEMNRALQAMRRHAEACRLPKKGKR